MRTMLSDIFCVDIGISLYNRNKQINLSARVMPICGLREGFIHISYKTTFSLGKPVHLISTKYISELLIFSL